MDVTKKLKKKRAAATSDGAAAAHAPPAEEVPDSEVGAEPAPEPADPPRATKRKRRSADAEPSADAAVGGDNTGDTVADDAIAAAAVAAAPRVRKAKAKRVRPPPVTAAAANADDGGDGGNDDDDDGDDGGGAPPAGGADLAREVYVEGLPYDADEGDIRAFFAGCGTITSVRAPTFHDSSRLRGYAHVEFSGRDGAAAALARDGRYLRDRFLTVQRPRPLTDGRAAALAVSARPRPAGCSTVFVKGLPYEAAEDAVRAAFRAFGAVASVRLARWNHTGRLKGYGYVQFEVPFSADAAMKAYRDGTASGRPLRVGDRAVHLDWETAAPRQSFKTSAGAPFFKTDEADAVRKAAQKAKLKSADRDEKREKRKAREAAAAAEGSDGDAAAAAGAATGGRGGGGRPGRPGGGGGRGEAGGGGRRGARDVVEG